MTVMQRLSTQQPGGASTWKRAVGTARLAACGVPLVLLACFDGTGPVTSEPVVTVSVSPQSAIVLRGETVTLQATVLGAAGSVLNVPVDWFSHDTDVAAVSTDGVVTGIEEGSVVITATVGSIHGDAVIAVVPPAPAPSSGKIAFVRQGRIYVVNSDGTDIVQLSAGPDDEEPTWSPDGRRIAFRRAGNLYVMDADGSNAVQRTAGGYGRAAWSPDGKRLAFIGQAAGALHLFVTSAVDDGAAPVDLTPDMPGWKGDPAWSPDGSRIAFVADWAAYDFVYDIYLIRPDGSDMLQKTIGWAFNGVAQNGEITVRYFFQPAWSPDGRQLAVVTCEGWAFTICENSAVGLFEASESFVLTGTSGGLTLLTNTKGYAHPTWSADGETIAYSSEGAIYWTRANGGGQGRIIENGDSPAWSP